MFKFNFELDDLEDTDPFDISEDVSTKVATKEADNTTLQSFKQYPIDELVSCICWPRHQSSR